MRDIARLPVLSTADGRNVLELAYTQPGTVPSNRGITVNGQRARQNHFVVDGATTNWAWNNQSFVTANSISPNAVEEFRIVTGAAKAEYGRSAGGTLIITTKSGGNEFHGMATEVFRNRELNAVPFFQKSVPGGTPRNFANGLPRKPDYKSHDFDAIGVCTSLPTTPHLVVGRSACRVGVGPSLNRSWAQRSRPVVQAGRRAFPGDESVVD